uniref:Uncharacterized protein n=1 Tax=Picea sitchensis TaxID=3332 RepID=A0A6B9XXD9_PICSI|nr:hypothetical protein Q903MT_gene6809 [Picea sitchensis]QHR92810.1 hypothetical protein Q903MT_gene6858 [Picea sitchensis]
MHRDDLQLTPTQQAQPIILPRPMVPQVPPSHQGQGAKEIGCPALSTLSVAPTVVSSQAY